jgi:glycosyltransferase involved in cell wall biosynthesis
VYDVQDIWPETLILAGLRRHGAVAALMRAAERRIYSSATHIVVPTEGAKANIESKGVSTAKVSVLPHWANPEDFIRVGPEEYDAVRADIHVRPGEFVVTFAGNLGFAQGLENLIEAAELLRSHSRIVFRLIGDGAAARQLKAVIESHHMTNIELLGRRNRTQTARVLAVSDALVVHLKSKELAEIALPGKTMPYMASGRPIVMAAGGAGAALIRSSAAGEVVNPADPRALANAIARLSELTKPELDAIGARGAAHVKANYSRTKIVDLLEAVLEAAAARH